MKNNKKEKMIQGTIYGFFKYAYRIRKQNKISDAHLIYLQIIYKNSMIITFIFYQFNSSILIFYSLSIYIDNFNKLNWRTYNINMMCTDLFPRYII